MSTSFIDDLANERHIVDVLEWAADGDEAVPLERLRRLACGNATSRDIEQRGEHWTETLLDLLQRGGIGQLERRQDGRIVFVFADPLPTAAEAWRRATGLGA
jgi:hypothetical protein